jgi:aldehyde dehydrogenase (NAD+)
VTVPFTSLDKLYIGGAWSRPVGGNREPVLNPATEEIIGHAPVGGSEDAQAAIAAAREAFDRGPWPHLPMLQRIEHIRRFKA